MKHYSSDVITLTAGGGTVDILCDEPFDHFEIKGTATLAGNWVIQPKNTAYEGQTIWFDYNAAITTGVNSLTIFGHALDSQVALKASCRIKCRYDGAAWKVKVLQSFSVTEFIVTTFIKAKNITFALIQDINGGSLIVGDAGKRPSELTVGTAAQVLANNGVLTFWETVGGILSKTGAAWTVIANGITGSMLNSNCAGVGMTYNTTTNKLDVTPGATESQTQKFTIPTADVLTGFATPVLLLPSPGAGKAIVVQNSQDGCTFVSAAYATNVTTQLITDTADIAQFEGTNHLATNKTALANMSVQTDTTKTQIIADKGLYFKVKTGNPITGDSDWTVVVTYKIVNV